jgi:flavodoxin
MKVLVAYESRGGRTKRAAEAIADAVRTSGLEADVRPLKEAEPDQVRAADVLFVGSWVEGFLFFGVGPAKAARQWVAGLPSLSGKHAAVFCTYALNPRGTLAALGSGLRAKGASIDGEAAFHHRRPTEGSAEFARRVLAAVLGEPA